MGPQVHGGEGASVSGFFSSSACRLPLRLALCDRPAPPLSTVRRCRRHHEPFFQYLIATVHIHPRFLPLLLPLFFASIASPSST